MKNICDWNNCSEIAEYKAPVERDNSKKFRMLCLKHVKEFNKNWNYSSEQYGCCHGQCCQNAGRREEKRNCRCCFG